MSRTALRLIAAAVAVAALFLASTVSSAAPVVGMYSSGTFAPPVPIADNPSVTTTVAVTVPNTPGVIADLNVYVRLAHPRDRDLHLTLEGPDATKVDLSSQNGDVNADYGSGTPDCNGTFTEFDDEASVAINSPSASAPFNGAFQPEQQLSSYDGKVANGTWKLEVTDDTSGPGGTAEIYCWKVEVTYAQTDLGLTMTDSPDPAVVGNDLTFVATVRNYGPDAAGNTVVTWTLPTGVTLKSLASTKGTCSAVDATPVKCDLGTLQPTDPDVLVTAVVTPTASGSIQTKAKVTSNVTEPGLDPHANEATEPTEVKADGSGGTETIKVTTSGSGRGTVTSEPKGIDCGYTCEAGFIKDTQVTLKATPATGSVFTEWGGVCAGTPADADCTVNASGTKTVTAKFTKSSGGGASGGGDTGGGSGGTTPGGTTTGGGTFDVCTITGTNKNDVLRGTKKADVICGFGGNDKIYGAGGNDRLYGGNGDDKLYGGNGNDKLYGGNGTDTLNGGKGTDRAQVSLADKMTSIEDSV